MKLRYLLPVAFLVAVFSANYVYATSIPANANAKSTSPISSPPSTTANSNVSTNANSAKTTHSAANSNGVIHAVVGLQKACLAHENNIKRRTNQMYNLSNNIINRFSVITSNVESYYNSTVIPKGIIVTNYSTLVSTVLSTQDTAQGQLNQFNLDYANFSCSSTNPQTQVLAFNSDMRVEITDLNVYKRAVINLLTAVRSAVGSTNSTK